MTNRWILRGAAAALALTAVACCAAAAGFVRISHARRTSLQDWNARRCEVYRSAVAGADDPCRASSQKAPVIPSFQAAKVDVANARAALASGDEAAATASLVRALDRASYAERRSSFLATTVAARIAALVLDELDAHSELARRPEMRAALARTRLSSIHRPFDAERMRIASETLGIDDRTSLLTWGVRDARVSDSVEAEDAALLAMQLAARDGDHARCVRASSRSPLGAGMCEHVEKTVKTARRLERARR